MLNAAAKRIIDKEIPSDIVYEGTTSAAPFRGM